MQVTNNKFNNGYCIEGCGIRIVGPYYGEIKSNLFKGNVAVIDGGAINYNCEKFLNCSAFLRNNTFLGNKAIRGGAIFWET